MTVLEVAEVASPVGTIALAVRDGRLCALKFPDGMARLRRALERRFGPVELRPTADPAGVAGRLRAYFAGDLHALDAIPVDAGGTPFQRAVWAALRQIPPGQTAAYRDVARTVGAPAAVRAVGAANGANPVGLVVPCHRVIGADGRLTGYGGGLEHKRWLLAHEGAQLL